ncbi:MAG: transposase, partial [Kiritimatiellae bacterium]|nr:transposase [Kiritimatiellia bacterium]
FRMETTTDLICRLKSDTNLRLICGFSDKKGLSGASFSRRNALFAEEKLAETLHEQVVKVTLNNSIEGDLNRDSTTIATREKPLNKKKDAEIKPKKRGRPKKGEKRTKELTVIEKQSALSAEDGLALVNSNAAWGGKRNSAGKYSYWKGYKLHRVVTDYGLPVTALVSGANVHDSQLAIPMEQISSSRINYCYSLMDSAYNSPIIENVCESLGHVAIIDPKKLKNKEKTPLEPAKAERYKIRTTVERANSHLKDSFLSKRIYVRGSPKVTFQLMCGVLCLTVQKILQYFILPELEKTVAA